VKTNIFIIVCHFYNTSGCPPQKKIIKEHKSTLNSRWMLLYDKTRFSGVPSLVCQMNVNTAYSTDMIHTAWECLGKRSSGQWRRNPWRTAHWSTVHYEAVHNSIYAFTKYYWIQTARTMIVLANMRPSREVFAAVGHLNSLSNTF
jgi:hypothetical protein